VFQRKTCCQLSLDFGSWVLSKLQNLLIIQVLYLGISVKKQGKLLFSVSGPAKWTQRCQRLFTAASDIMLNIHLTCEATWLASWKLI